MELRATMELRDGRGGQLGEENPPFIVKGQIQPVSTYLARDLRYYRTRHAVLPQGPAVLPHGTAVLSLARQGLDQTCSAEAESGRTASAVLPRPLAVLPQGWISLG